MFGSRLAVVPGGALIVPSGSGGVGEWGGMSWAEKRIFEGLGGNQMRDAEVDVTLPKPLQAGRVGGSRAATTVAPPELPSTEGGGKYK